LVIDTSGNVGIGTTDPSTNRLRVVGGTTRLEGGLTITTGGANITGSTVFQDAAATLNIPRIINTQAFSTANLLQTSFELRDNAGNNTQYGMIEVNSLVTTDGSEDGTFNIKTLVDGTSDSRIFINGTGNVGIGTTGPLAMLHLSNNSGPELRLENTAANDSGWVTFWSGGARKGYIQFINAASQITFDAAGTTNGFNFKSGNVGIGTTSPTAKLHVVGNITATGTIGGITIKPTDTINISPEFPTAVLKGTGVGAMTASFDATNYRNYYNWTTTGSNQAYDIYVRVLIPEDFGTWDGTAAVTYYTNIDATPGNSGVTMVIYDTVNAVSYTGSKISTPAATWSANTIGSASLGGLYTAGSYMTLKFTMTADSGKNAKVGEVKLKYNKI
jgi:hypothetical protein